MKCFDNFTDSIWVIFYGNLLLLFCSLFYLIWWIVSFRPDSPGGAIGVFSIIAALIAGVVAITLMSTGILSLSFISKGLPVKFILIGGAVLFVVLLLVTNMAFHRIVTSELIIMHIWAALELSAVAVLYGTGRFGSGRATALGALVGIATVVGLICYVLYYRLDGMSSYWDGMVPLITDSFVMAVFLGVLAVS
ncbi:hypothetical protein [Desulfosporosinus sp. OT]|uniref:hypothetical protein n=1 Tax=Desulfosporosinus sp. OT TaxID=913865 RepID=UPI000223A069|nr:hypothetical protein [Desulfosporosinus sp. OT]EGW37166.1 putative membrane protein [Desulfosporosinus sp. OT]